MQKYDKQFSLSHTETYIPIGAEKCLSTRHDEELSKSYGGNICLMNPHMQKNKNVTTGRVRNKKRQNTVQHDPLYMRTPWYLQGRWRKKSATHVSHDPICKGLARASESLRRCSCATLVACGVELDFKNDIL